MTRKRRKKQRRWFCAVHGGKRRKWWRKPPPSGGWWPASAAVPPDPSQLRWFNTSTGLWSHACSHLLTAAEAAQWARTAAPLPLQQQIAWTARPTTWPHWSYT